MFLRVSRTRRHHSLPGRSVLPNRDRKGVGAFMPKQLMKGNEAVLRGAVLAGCRAFYSYPITPASEIGETAAQLLPQVGGTFLQSESETAAVNMLYGAASTGIRCMTASSGPG